MRYQPLTLLLILVLSLVSCQSGGDSVQTEKDYEKMKEEVKKWKVDYEKFRKDSLFIATRMKEAVDEASFISESHSLLVELKNATLTEAKEVKVLFSINNMGEDGEYLILSEEFSVSDNTGKHYSLSSLALSDKELSLDAPSNPQLLPKGTFIKLEATFDGLAEGSENLNLSFPMIKNPKSDNAEGEVVRFYKIKIN